MINVTSGNSVDLVSAINSTDKLIYIEGNYELDVSSPSNRLVSIIQARKIIGINDTAKITFTNIPNGALVNPIVCLDFQSKSRIYNVKFDFIPNSSLTNNINIIGIRFKRNLSYTYESVGSGTSFLELPTITPTSTDIILSGIINKVIPKSNLLKTKYYFEIRNPTAETSKESYTFLTLDETDIPDSYQWSVDTGADEADMDSSLSGCTLSFKSNTPLSTYTNRSVVGIDYYGRNLSCDLCTFNNLGTSIRIQFPPTITLSAPGSQTNPYQSGYYGHRKCSITRNVFNTSFNCISLTGYVTIRGMLVYNNTVNNGQLIFSDGPGGIKSSLIVQNIVSNNIENPNLKSVILIANGVFVDNSINNNNFTGSIESSITILTTTNYNNMFSNNTFKNNTKNVFLIQKTDSICITNNIFESSTSPNLVIVRLGSKNLNISFNTLKNINLQSLTSFINLRDSSSNAGQNYSRIVVTKNKLQSSSNIQVLSTLSLNVVSLPYFIQNNF